MVLIFGGAYQGKLDYAVKEYGLSEGDVYRCSGDDASEPGGKRAIAGIDKWILALVKAGTDPRDAVRRFIANNESAVVTCDDISCGVVPIDPMLRKYREAAGRALTELSAASEAVVRVFCGIPTRLK